MRRRTLSTCFFLCFAAVIGSAGCNGEPVGTDDRGLHAVIKGSVLDESGSPVPDVSLLISMFEPDCGENAELLQDFTASTDSEGAWSERFGSALIVSETGCARVIATPPQDRSLQPDTVFGTPVDLRPIGQEPDTAIIPLVLSEN